MRNRGRRLEQRVNGAYVEGEDKMAEVEIIGADRLIARINAIAKSFDPVTEKALKETTANIRDEAKRLCPVDTGSLQKSIRRTAYARVAGHVQQMGVRVGGYIINPKTGRLVDYARHVEYGTSRSQAQPFLRPAVLKYKRELVKIVKRGIKK